MFTSLTHDNPDIGLQYEQANADDRPACVGGQIAFRL